MLAVGLGPEADFWVKPPQNEVPFGFKYLSVIQGHPSLYRQSQHGCIRHPEGQSREVLSGFTLLTGAHENLTERVLEGEVRIWQAEERKSILGTRDRLQGNRDGWTFLEHRAQPSVMGAETRNAKTSVFPVLHPQGTALGLVQMKSSINTSG